MRKFLVLSIILLLLIVGCNNSVQREVNKDTLLYNFYNSHSFNGDYLLKTKLNIKSTSKTITQILTFGKKNNDGFRMVEADGVKLRQFTKLHHLIEINDITGEVKRVFINKNDNIEDDQRKLIIGRQNFLKKDPKVIEEDGYVIEEYEDNGVIYQYGFKDSNLEFLRNPSKEGIIQFDILSIEYNVDDSLFQK